MTAHRLAHVLLQLAQILPLRGNSALSARRVPGSGQPAAFLVALDFKRDLGPLTLFLQIRFHSLVFNLALNFV